MTDEYDFGDLPDDAAELYTLATTESTFPYEREAAIKKLATLESDRAETHLSSLAAGDALTSIEQDLAMAKLDDDDA